MSSGSPSLLEMISESLGKEGIAQISQQIGASESQTSSAIGAALPALLGGMSRQGSTADGLSGLMGMLDQFGGGKESSGGGGSSIGGLLGSLSGLLGGGGSGGGSAGGINPADLLGGLLGGSQGKVENGVQQASGLSSAATKSLLAILAPLILGALIKSKQSQGLDGAGLKDLLGREQASVEQKTGGLIGKFLDQDGDGDFDLNDVAKLAMGQLFGKK